MAATRLNIPNTLTALRIAALPVFGWLWLQGSTAALWVMGAAAFTDLFDGLLARKLNQQTALGARLDPVADKLFVFVSLLVALWRGAAPLWFVETIVGRDAVMALGAIAVMRIDPAYYKGTVWKPTFLGKFASSSVAFVCGMIALEDLVLPGNTLGWILTALMAGCGVLVVATLLQYAVTAIRGLRAAKAERERASAGGEGDAPK
ncbi:MAG: CDP-alcohol phosphatidyltransferase family protein [Myxococcales bacterium]|nr:CDP-alcohol phosphatidyltransferase family protein [Myxococcales bacterium]